MKIPRSTKASIIALAKALERNDHLDEQQWQMVDAIEALEAAPAAAVSPEKARGCATKAPHV